MRSVRYAIIVLVALSGFASAPARLHAQIDVTRMAPETLQVVAATIDSLRAQRRAFAKRPDLDTPSRYFTTQDQLNAMRGTVEGAERLARVLSRSYERTQSNSPHISRNLAIVRSLTSTQAQVLEACNELYFGGDPRIFDRSVAACRENYSPANDYYARVRAGAAADSTASHGLRAEIDSARTTIDVVAQAIQTARERLEGEVQGRFAFRTALWLIGGTSLILVAILLFARADRGRPAFSVAHATEMVTVLAVVMAVIFFGSIHALGGESVAGLLAGIVGYVLGQRSQALSGGRTKPAAEPGGD